LRSSSEEHFTVETTGKSIRPQSCLADPRRREQVRGSSLVLPWLTVLNVFPEGGRRVGHVVILPANLDPEAFRTLRVLLRWSRSVPESSGVPRNTLNNQG
jgi:hypothetical protein